MVESPCCEVVGFDANIGRCRPCKDLHVERIDVSCLQTLPVAAKFAQIHDLEPILGDARLDDAFGVIEILRCAFRIEHFLVNTYIEASNAECCYR